MLGLGCAGVRLCCGQAVLRSVFPGNQTVLDSGCAEVRLCWGQIVLRSFCPGSQTVLDSGCAGVRLSWTSDCPGVRLCWSQAVLRSGSPGRKVVLGDRLSWGAGYAGGQVVAAGEDRPWSHPRAHTLRLLPAAVCYWFDICVRRMLLVSCICLDSVSGVLLCVSVFCQGRACSSSELVTLMHSG